MFLPEVLGLRVDGHELSPTAETIACYDGSARYSVRVPAGGAAQPRTAREPLNLELAATLVPGTVAVGDEHAPVALRVPVRVGVRLQVAEPLAGRTGSRFAVEAVSVSFAPHPPLGLTPPPFLTA